MADLTHVSCNGCGYVFPDSDEALLPQSQRPACPECGQTGRTAHVYAQATVVGHASVSGVAFTGSKRKWFAKFWSGQRSLFRKTGRWHVLNRHMDKRADTYDEVYHDEETGAVVHECHEPLSEHQGHGSARGSRP